MNKKSIENKTITQFLITLLIVILVILGIYILTKYVIKKDNNTAQSNETSYIDPSAAIVGTMLKKSATEYYVFIYDTKSENAMDEIRLVSQYNNTQNHLPVYVVDLSNALNSKYKVQDGEKTNPMSSQLSELKFGNLTLLKIKNNKIIECYEGLDNIKKTFNLE